MHEAMNEVEMEVSPIWHVKHVDDRVEGEGPEVGVHRNDVIGP
jgi:hypothetical protein